ncbi:MAG: TRAP transporter small permease [Desulfobacterales bacterium]|jgi:TRAP-type C4-dicarboxylate transport system permease small subunit
MHLLDGISRRLNQAMKFLAGFLIAAMTILVFLQVVFRYLLDAPLDWSEEMASFAFVWMALLGASVGLKNDDHPGLDIFYQIFPDWAKKLCGIIINLAILFMLVVLFIFGLKLTIAMQMQRTAALGYSISYVYAVLPLSAIIMFIHVSVKFVLLIANSKAEEIKSP